MQYYNYFTEVEDRFRLARNSGMFMMSPLDWVLVESWKDAGVPLAAVLKGIDRAFEKYHAAKRRRFSTVNSVAYCTQEVLGAARDMAHGAPWPLRRQLRDSSRPLWSRSLKSARNSSGELRVRVLSGVICLRKRRVC